MWGVFLVATDDDDASNKLVSKIYNSTVAGLMNDSKLLKDFKPTTGNDGQPWKSCLCFRR